MIIKQMKNPKSRLNIAKGNAEKLQGKEENSCFNSARNVDKLEHDMAQE